MLVEIVGDDMYYQALTDTGKTVDSGTVHRVGKVEPTPNRSAQPVVATSGNDAAKPAPTPDNKPAPTPPPSAAPGKTNAK
jgi:hypothetical protein